MQFALLFFAFAFIPFVNRAAGQELSLTFAEHGPYAVGVLTLEQIDPMRDDRVLITEVWYPAETVLDETPDVQRDAPPLAAHSVFPLIVYSHGNYGHRTEMAFLLEHLASYGYVVAAMDHNDSEDAQWRGLIDRPQDVLFALDNLPRALPEPLAAFVDWGRIGVAGFSFGGYTAVAMSGAQIDPECYLDACIAGGLRDSSPCRYVPDWDSVAMYRAQYDTLPEVGMWPATTDDRIQAVLAMSPSRSILFGEAGLAASKTPMLIVHGVLDEWANYATEVLFMVDHLSGDPVVLLSVLEGSHYFPAEPDYQDALRHFTVAWFDWQLAGEGDDPMRATYFDSAVLDDVPGWVLGEVRP